MIGVYWNLANVHLSVSCHTIITGVFCGLYLFLLFILEKKRYRESYISDDLDLDPHGSESSPGLSRHSTSSSGIEADGRQHSVSPEIASMEEESHQPVEKSMSSAASCASSCTSGFEAGSKAQTLDDGWKEKGVY